MEVSAKEPAAPLAAISGQVEEPNVTPEQQEEKGKGEAPHSSFPGWMEVLHPTQLVTSARQTPLTLHELRQRCHIQSVGGGSLASKSRRVETSHTGKIGLKVLTRVPQTHA